jgi:MOSC domain-containing protein YiiM
MRLESVNIGRSEKISHGDRSFVTGICKYPAEGPVEIASEGIADDAIVATEHHGGADQAIYAYSADDYDWWAERTGREFFPGLFGENLTIRDLPSDMRIGDRLLIGEVVLEATAPRIPCGTFAARMQDSSFGLAFREAERPGIYFRVLNEGEVAAGDTVTFIENEESDVTILELFRFYYARQHDVDALRRLLEAPLAERMRVKVESKLAALG